MRTSYKISVVTVTYNCESTIKSTIESIVNQTYQNIEYIVVDGQSNDRTKDIIGQYSCQIHTFISEKDNGIFDAMNKAVLLATGDYIVFINSGDRFADNQVIERTFSKYTDDHDLIYGDVYIENEFGLKLEKADAIYLKKYTPYDLVFKSQGFCHQSLFTKTSILKNVMFNTNYPIGADYDTTYKVFLQGNHKIKYLEYPVAIFSALPDGASHNGKFMREIYDERCLMFNVKKNLVYYCRIQCMKMVVDGKVLLERLFPKLVKKIRKRNYN